MFYCLVDPSGYIIKSGLTLYKQATPMPGYRLLPDNPPTDYIQGLQKIVRIEPVPLDATEIPYEIVDVPLPI